MNQHMRNGVAFPENRNPFGRTSSPYSLRSVMEDVIGVIAALWEGRWWIAITAALFVIPVIAWLLITPAQYEATAKILLDPRPAKLVDGAVVQSGLGESSVGADTLLVDSQTEIMTSRPVLQKVIRDEKLINDPEFFKPRGEGMRIRLRNLFGSLLPGYEPTQAHISEPSDLVLQEFREKHLFANRVGNTYIIDVGVISEDPDKAARLANAVARAYISGQVEFLSDTTREATADLESRIEELRDRVRIAENKVEAYRKSKGLLGAPGMLSTEQRLQELNSRLASARAEAALAKARYERLRDNTAENVAAGNTSEALDNKALVNLRALLAQAERRLSGMSGELGPQHPELIRARQEKDGIMRLIGDELTRIRAVARSEYELARENEASLERELKDAQSNVADNNQSLVKLRDLEREASAAKAVLESFLVRARETSEQEGLGRANSRIIAAASAPTRPSFPPTRLIAAAALFAGLLAGAFIVWIRHIMTAPVPLPVYQGGYAATIDEEGRLLAPVRHRRRDDEDILRPEVLDAFQARLDEMRRRARGNPPPGQ